MKKKELEYPIYVTDGLHYFKIFSSKKHLEVLPSERVSVTDNEFIDTNVFDQFKRGELIISHEFEFNLYREHTIKHLNTL